VSDVLHAVRVKGVASPEAVATATASTAEQALAELRQLEAEDFVLQRQSRRRPGWVLTEAGHERHAVWLAAAHDPEELAQVDRAYGGFLAVNAPVKAVFARWQAAPGAERIELVDTVERLHDRAAPSLAEAAVAVARFGRYRDRLALAMERLDEDPGYFVGTEVDSLHTIWFECHEDFLLTLGRTRAEEGSE
jgi:hypothetical protein